MLTFNGCAGWSIPKPYADHFPAAGSHLERYAACLGAVEINSSFYRPHRPQTYAKWAACVPADFRFAVKVPKSITHEHRLQDTRELWDTFLAQVAGLGEKLGPLLVQLPPSLAFDNAVAKTFFADLRGRFTGQVVCEPRHVSWFVPVAGDLLTEFRVARVAADPVPVPVPSPFAALAAQPGGWGGLAYYRLHGSPMIYRSAYAPEFLEKLATSVQNNPQRSVPTWCIFDNTAEGAAMGNVLEFKEIVK